MLTFALSLFADGSNYDTDWPIYVYGNTEIYYKVFTFVAELVNGDISSRFIELAALISLMFAGKKLYEAELGGALKQTAWTVGIAAFLLYPNSTVHIIDKRVENNIVGYNGAAYDKVDHIPLFLAATASFASAITSDAIQIIDSAMADPNAESATVSNSGFAAPYMALMKLVTVAMSTDGNTTSAKAIRELNAYVRDCAIKGALNKDPNKYTELISSKKNIIDALDPDNLGLDTETVVFDDNEYKCTDFYNNQIRNGKTTIENMFKTTLANSLTSLDINSSSVVLFYNKMKKLYLAGTTIADFQDLLYNIRTSKAISSELNKIGYGISGLNIATNTTFEKSRQNIMVEGIGTFNWVAKILPMAINFFFTLIIALYVPMAIVAMLLGMERGGKILMNYAFGLIAFMFSGAALAIVQNLVNYYGGSKMVELYTAFGNPLTLAHIPKFIETAATMAGLAGILGAVAVPLTIGIVFKGETMAAVGALSSIRGMYAGNTLDNAKNDIARNIANREAEHLEDEKYGEMITQDKMKWLNEHGFFPTSTAEAARLYAQIQSELSTLGTGYGAEQVLQKRGVAQDIVAGNELHAIKSLSSQSAYGSSLRQGRTFVDSMEVAEQAGEIAGATEAHSDIATVNAIDKVGMDNYLKGVENQTGKKIASTAGYGKDISFDEAIKAGDISGRAMAHSDTGLIKGVEHEKGGLDNYLKGVEHQAIKQASTTITYGKNTTEDGAFDDGRFTGDKMAGAARGAHDYFKTHKSVTLSDIDNMLHDTNMRLAHTRNDKRRKELLARKEQLEQLRSDIEKMGGVLDADSAIIKGGENSQIEALEAMASTGLGNEDDFKARGSVKGLQSAFDARGYLNSQITDDRGNLRFTRGEKSEIESKMQEVSSLMQGAKEDMEAFKGKDAQKYQEAKKRFEGYAKELNSLQDALEKSDNHEVANTELMGFTEGAERFSRTGINKTIGAGKAQFTNRHGNEISERQYMANIQKTSGFGFVAEGIKGETAGRYGMDIEHQKGYISGMHIRDNVAKGLARKESENYASLEAKAQAFGKDGKLVSDAEYYKNVRTNAISKESKTQINADELQDKYGENLRTKGDFAHVTQTAQSKIEKRSKIADSLLKEINALNKAKDIDEKAGLGHSAKAIEGLIQDKYSQINQLSKEMEQIGLSGLVDMKKSYANVQSNIAKAKIDSEMGMAEGIEKNLAKNGAMYVQNAQYSEMSKQQSAQAKIETAGDINEAVALDATQVSLKTAEIKGATEGKMSELFKSIGLDAKDAKELTKAIMDGTVQGGEILKRALEDASNISAMRSAKDMAFSDQQLKMYENKAANQVAVNSILRRAKDPELVQKQMIRAGLVDHNGRATTGVDFISAMARLRAGDMERDKQLVIGGERFNLDRDIDGNVLLNNSTMESTQRGWKYDGYFKGALGDYAGMALEMGAAAIAIDKLTKHYSGKGVFERVFDKTDQIGDSIRKSIGLPTSEEKSMKESSNSTSHHQNRQSAHNIENQTAKHLNTPYSNIKPDEASESICYIVALLIFANS